MSRYKLSRNIAIQEPDAADPEYLPEAYRRGYFVLYHKSRDREYLINETVRYFIGKFSTPKNLETIISEVADDVRSESSLVSDTCTSFVRFLRKRRFIIPEDEEELELTTEPCYVAGSSINQYQITDVLVCKRTIDIYRAVDSASGQKVVIKLLNRKKIRRDRSFLKERDYLEREFLFLRKMDGNSAVCQAIAFEEDQQGQPFIVLELIEGEAIFRGIAEQPQISIQNILGVFSRMLNAFASLHAAGIVHGDVHSGNVLVTEDGSVRLIDLGLSISEHIEEKQVVKHGGVDYYMPPERINTTTLNKFAKGPSFASDVYQVGLIMYVILYDEFPFDGFTWEELSASIKGASIDFPLHSDSGDPVPYYLIEVIRKSLQKDPQARFKDAGEMQAAFLQGLSQTKVPALANA